MSIFDKSEHDENIANLIEDIREYQALCFVRELYKITALILDSCHKPEREDKNCVGN